MGAFTDWGRSGNHSQNPLLCEVMAFLIPTFSSSCFKLMQKTTAHFFLCNSSGSEHIGLFGNLSHCLTKSRKATLLAGAKEKLKLNNT